MLRRLFLIVALLPLTACKPFQSQYALDTVPPPDFSLEVAVATPWRGDVGALATPSQYVVMPNRALHAAIGPGATIQYFPPTTARLSHEQFAAIGLYDEHIIRDKPVLPAWDLQLAKILTCSAVNFCGSQHVMDESNPEQLCPRSWDISPTYRHFLHTAHW